METEAEAFVSGTPSTWVPAETCRPSDGKAKRSASLSAMPCGYHRLLGSAVRVPSTGVLVGAGVFPRSEELGYGKLDRRWAMYHPSGGKSIPPKGPDINST
jgi:hypothetical protein